MSDDDMVDRVARALIDADPTMFGYHETHVASKRDAARAAIEAMREPTRAMASAAMCALDASQVAGTEISSVEWGAHIKIYQAAIDASLANKTMGRR